MQACTEMVMPMTCSNESMFPPNEFDYEQFAADCKKRYGVSPRPHWITTEFGGKVRFPSHFISISYYCISKHANKAELPEKEWKSRGNIIWYNSL